MELRVLGPIEVIHGGQALAVGGTRARAVLAVLLLNANRVVSADRLASELWPDLEPERAAANLQVRLTELRRALRSAGEADRLVTRPPGYAFRATADELDLMRFEQLAAAGRTALAGGDAAGAARLLDDSLALWRGPALADLGDPLFAGTERARLEDARLDAVESRVEALLACGRHQETIAELEELTAKHPLRERFWAQRLLALYRCGRQADALRAYRELRAVLVRQLGIEPGPELRQLEGRILRQDSQLEYRACRRAAGDHIDQPVTRYVDSGGIHIAYQVLGAGERDIVFVPGAMSHLDLLWEDLETAAFFRRLSTLGRLILFDKRDTGLSDRAPADSPLEERMDDVRAVMGAASSSQAVLFGYSEGAPMSILFAATHPERVAALILGAATARYLWTPDYPCGQGSEEMFEALTEIAGHRWGQGATIEWFLPSRAGSPEARRLFGRFERMAVSPSAFLRIIRMIRQIDVRAVLPAIHVPTLVVQRLDDRMTPPATGATWPPTSRAPATSNSVATIRYGSPEAETATCSSMRSRTSSQAHHVPGIPIGCWPPSCSPKRKTGRRRLVRPAGTIRPASWAPTRRQPGSEYIPIAVASSRAPGQASLPPSLLRGKRSAVQLPSAMTPPHGGSRRVPESTPVKWTLPVTTSPGSPSPTVDRTNSAGSPIKCRCSPSLGPDDRAGPVRHRIFPVLRPRGDCIKSSSGAPAAAGARE
ncbi:MAG TPA: BTAD domain-containing putative transcriptional regulator [Streptosporangiaceae bacterium]